MVQLEKCRLKLVNVYKQLINGLASSLHSMVGTILTYSCCGVKRTPPFSGGREEAKAIVVLEDPPNNLSVYGSVCMRSVSG